VSAIPGALSDRGTRRSGSFERQRVDEIQRARLLSALREVVAEQGVSGATVGHVVARAGVSRRTFYELFADREECFLAAFDQAIVLAAQRVAPAFGEPGRWRERVRAALLELLALFDEEPELGALCVVHALGAGPDALERRARIVRVLVAAVEEGRVEARKGHEPAPLAAEGVVGAVLAVLHARLSQHPGRPLTALAGSLMSMIVLPYLGLAAAERELERPVQRTASKRRVAAREDLLKDLDMRLTYRTVRVLLAIAHEPGASNRHVGEVAGIVDQGQASKLLRRLAHLGLIENVAFGDGQRGEPNAWTLTARGERLRHTIQTQPTPES
jgi:AcrR family transcriptional regulator